MTKEVCKSGNRMKSLHHLINPAIFHHHVGSWNTNLSNQINCSKKEGWQILIRLELEFAKGVVKVRFWKPAMKICNEPSSSWGSVYKGLTQAMDRHVPWPYHFMATPMKQAVKSEGNPRRWANCEAIRLEHGHAVFATGRLRGFTRCLRLPLAGLAR